MVETYAKTANEIRKTVLEMIYKAQVSHIGSNYSCIDILTVLYAKMNPKIDKLVVSKGWVAASIYAFNVKYGYMPQEAIDTFCDGKSPYIGLIEPLNYFACEVGTGSMGLGLPTAVGIALAKKLKGEEGKVYCLMSDGETQIGTFWESMLIAKQHELDNLVVIVDWNGLQAMGSTSDVLKVPNYFCDKFVDGHDYNELEIMLNRGIGCIYASTIKGKGVSFMENNNLYHYKQLSEEEYNKAKEELNEK